MMIIRTAYKTNASGRGQIVAKGGGKQKTVNYDDAVSNNRNHGNAAGELAFILGLSWHDEIGHDQSSDGCKHGFAF